MVGKNWVRTRDTEDGRAQLLELTPKGRKVFVAAAPAWEAAQKETMALLGPDSGAALGHLLKEERAEQKPYASIEEFARQAFPAHNA